MKRRTFHLQLAASLAAAHAMSVGAQDRFPAKPVKIVVPFAPGGGPDVLTRKAAPRLAEILGQNVVVENIVGAGGILATQTVARAPADGYTLIVGATTQVVQKAMQPSARFDPVKDFVHILRNNITPQLLVVAANAPWKTAQELAEAIRKEPGKHNYGSGGVGSSAHLAGAAMMHALNLNAVHVPYKGSVDIIPSLLSGATQFAFPVASTAIAPAQQGQVRVLATTGSSRLAQLPNIPTLKEALGHDDLVVETWGGYWAPAGTPPAVVEVLYQALLKLSNHPDTRADFAAAGAVVSISASPAEFTREVAASAQKYERLVKAIGLTAN